MRPMGEPYVSEYLPALMDRYRPEEELWASSEWAVAVAEGLKEDAEWAVVGAVPGAVAGAEVE